MLRSSLALLTLAALMGAAHAEVKVLRAPRGAEVPEVVQDAHGVLHMTYGHGQPGNGYYVQSRDYGKTFIEPVQLNTEADTVTTGMERSPKLALGKDGSIHVVWLGYYKKGGGVWYTRSTDGGKHFERPRVLNEMRPSDNASVAADADGNVFVLWTGQWPGFVVDDPQNPIASPIILAHSKDNGKTFATQPLKHDYPGRACGCCRLEARVGADGNLYIAFRGGYHGIRDPFLLKGNKTENDFRVVGVHQDNWQFGCPMSGMPFSVDAKGRVLFTWMSRDKVYWALSDDGANRFSPPIPASGSGKQAAPVIVWGPKQEVLLVWKEGSAVLWALYGKDRTLMEQGKAGELPGTNKATAFRGIDGNLYVVF